MSFTPEPTRKRFAGWSVEKQVDFINLLATFGSVRKAAEAVGMSESAAYRLRARPDYESFHKAWDIALASAGTQLLAVAVDCALHGSPREYWREGKLVGTLVTPSDKMLMWAVDRLKPGRQPASAHASPNMVIDAVRGFRNLDLQIDCPIAEERAPEPRAAEQAEQPPSRACANPPGVSRVSRVSRPMKNPPGPRPDRKRLPAQ